MEVPAEHLPALQSLLAKLTLKKAPKKSKADYDVVRVLAHTVNENGEWSFLLRFKCGSEEWIPDKDCHCEALIKEYMSTHAVRVRTAYLICRVSSLVNREEYKVTTLDAQLQAVRAVAIKDYPDYRHKVVQFVCGAYKRLPRILEDVCESASPNDVLLVHRVDRLSRNMSAVSLLTDLMKRGVQIRSVDDNIELKPSSQSDFWQALVHAQREAERMSVRSKGTLQYRRARGDYIGSAKYGYKLVREPLEPAAAASAAKAAAAQPDSGESKKPLYRVVLRENEYEQKIISKVRSSKKSDQEIADAFNEKGITKRGKPWTAGMVGALRVGCKRPPNSSYEVSAKKSRRNSTDTDSSGFSE
jgi:DNA invertase Pin-like site-specific DNA recombinase